MTSSTTDKMLRAFLTIFLLLTGYGGWCRIISDKDLCRSRGDSVKQVRASNVSKAIDKDLIFQLHSLEIDPVQLARTCSRSCLRCCFAGSRDDIKRGNIGIAICEAKLGVREPRARPMTAVAKHTSRSSIVCEGSNETHRVDAISVHYFHYSFR